jgi:hypothetical protein
LIYETLTTLAAVAAALTAAWQLWALRRDALDARVAEIEGVSVSTDVVVRPTADEIVDGFGDWEYEYSISNPGKLPISKVDVEIEFPCPVRRRQWNDDLEAATRTERFHVAVVPAGTTHPPRLRVFSIHEDYRDVLKDARISVTFNTPDAGRHSTNWPAQPSGRLSRALVKRLER